MKKLILPFLLLATGALFAQEESSLLARLQSETRALADAADGAVVTVVGRTKTRSANAAQHAYDVYDKAGRVRQRFVTGPLGASTKRAPVAGVLVGSPARIVFPANAAGSAATARVRLPDGTEAEVRRIDGDAELGIDVYALPEGTEARGLDVEGEWTRLERGTIAVQAGTKTAGPLGLALVREADPRTGRLSIEGGGSGAALVGTGRTLLGVRGSATNWNCGACHVTGSVSVPLVASGAHGTLKNFYVRNSTYQGRSQCAHGYTNGWTPYVPGPVVRRVLEDIEQHGKIRRGYVGIVLGDSVGKDGKSGIAVTAVLDDSPAQAAGVKAGDRITAVDGLPCKSSAVASRVLVLKRPGDTVAFSLRRGEETIEAPVELADRAEAQRHLVTAENVGLQCVELTDELRGWLGLAVGVDGVLVRRSYGNAQRAGLRRGDVVVWGAGSAITNLEELGAALAGAKDSVALRVLRAGKAISVTVKLPQGKGSTR